MKFLKGLFYFLAFLYIVACVALYFAQERIIFLPQKLSKTHKFRTGEEVNIEVAEGISLNCLHIKSPNPKGVILYLHGNKGHIKRCIRQSASMSGNGYDIFIPDYRGYGKSDGKMESEQQIYDDLDKIYAHVKTLYPENKIIITGYSLGSGMATYLSHKNNPSQLFLLAPYESLVNIKDRWLWCTPDFLLKYHLPSYKYLADVERHRSTVFNSKFKSTFRQKVK